MRLFISISVILAIILLNMGCHSYEYKCDVEQRDSIYNHTTFNKDFIRDLKYYQKLETFLISHLDIIISYNKDDRPIFLKNEYGELVHSEMPPIILNEFMSIYKQFDNRALYYFQVRKDSTINICISGSEGPIDVFHTFKWDKNPTLHQKQNDFSNPDSRLYKDTMLNEKVKYEIYVGCHMR